MMTRILAVLLVVQIALVAVLYWPEDLDTRARAALLRDLQRSSIERMAIQDKDGNAIHLERAGETWLLESGLPASAVKVDTLLRALVDVDPGYAIAQSDSAASRFRVASDAFERRIEFDGATSAVVFLGSAPSYRKIHARREGENAVFVIDLNSYDAPSSAGDWLDRSLLAQRSVDAITLYGISFTLGDGTWARSDDAPVDAQAMERLVQALGSLQVTGISEADSEDLAEAGEALRIEVTKNNQTTRLTVLENADSERVYLQSDTYPQTFDTSAYDADRLLEAAREVGGIRDEAEPDTDEDANSLGISPDTAPNEVPLEKLLQQNSRI